MTDYLLRPIGTVESELTDRATAPRQPDEGAPPAWIVLDDRYAEALEGLTPGMDLVLLTWLDRADRDTLAVHPRGDTSRPLSGVFSTRSPHRPNPIGLHEVRILSIAGARIRVAHLEAFDGTPVLDIKPVLPAAAANR
ncbi:tRNA (N6-threonylcarbamoyladenosine(37)-N6)-methyltransferase TrmO [Nocardia africana]|uniref:Putative methyltransferase, YaeB/AF_0241 family n=1 Tax=Nocardia africana TaxID=134964 RepID=A0A378X1S7_9NOCA|nr:tRNA (N6-threonylcarbamoyladenosine(37)-N6)-methyltransferase TrmO [Nocardia africana]MCC3316829.1 tRNA (N6-threonylcarbamoyladenosine(37)-N6)-methyltransferase TrmO [Nocardia africana]SUA47550.1 putative methyltransferase, YaeB/AF_0241 family [Nocardia africana]